MCLKDFCKNNDKNISFFSGIFLSILIFNIFLCSNLYAGNLNIDSSLSIEEEYDDNAFLSADKEIDDAITRIKPSIDGKYEFSSRSYIEAKYNGEAIFHRKNMPFVEDEIRHQLESLLNIGVTDALSIKLSDEYNEIPINIRDPERFKGSFNNLSGKNTFYSSLIYNKKLSSTFNLNIEPFYRKIKIEDSNINDREISGFKTELRKNVTSTISVFGEYEFNSAKQSLSPNYDSHSFRGGLNYAWKDKFLLSFSGGKHQKQYEGQGNLDGFVITTRGDYKLSKNLGISAEFNKSLEDDEGKRNAVQNASKRNELNVSLEYRFLNNKGNINLSGLFARKKFIEVKREDNTDSFSIGGVYFPSKKISFVFNAQYRENEFISDLQERNDDIIQGSTGINYHPFDWLSTGLRYSRQDRDSSADKNKYVVNRYIFQVTLIF